MFLTQSSSQTVPVLRPWHTSPGQFSLLQRLGSEMPPKTKTSCRKSWSPCDNANRCVCVCVSNLQWINLWKDSQQKVLLGRGENEETGLVGRSRTLWECPGGLYHVSFLQPPRCHEVHSFPLSDMPSYLTSETRNIEPSDYGLEHRKLLCYNKPSPCPH